MTHSIPFKMTITAGKFVWMFVLSLISLMTQPLYFNKDYKDVIDF